jgi:hypothetical protein
MGKNGMWKQQSFTGQIFILDLLWTIHQRKSLRSPELQTCIALFLPYYQNLVAKTDRETEKAKAMSECCVRGMAGCC